jgi:hypothetical protein
VFKQVQLPASLSLAQALVIVLRECAPSSAGKDPANSADNICDTLVATCARLATSSAELSESSRPLHVYGVMSGDALEVRYRSKDDLKKREQARRATASNGRAAMLHGGDAGLALVAQHGNLVSQYAHDSDDAAQLFGVPLWRTIERERELGRVASVPFVVEALCDLLRAKHLSEPGIFRVSGQTDAVQALRNKVGTMTARGKFDISMLVADDVHACANVLKQYIRELPDPLIPFEMFELVLRFADVDDESLRARQLRAAMAELPLERYAVLRYLIEFLTDVHAFAAVNQMTSSNLSIIFGPALLHPAADQVASPQYLLAMPKVNLVIDSIIAHADYVFDIGLPQLLQVTPDHIRAAQAAVDEEKDLRRQQQLQRAAAAATNTNTSNSNSNGNNNNTSSNGSGGKIGVSASMPVLNSSAVAAAKAAAAAAAVAVPSTTSSRTSQTCANGGAGGAGKPVRFCEICQKKRAKHVVNFKNGTRWMLCPECLDRARTQRDANKSRSGPQAVPATLTTAAGPPPTSAPPPVPRPSSPVPRPSSPVPRTSSPTPQVVPISAPSMVQVRASTDAVRRPSRVDDAGPLSKSSQLPSDRARSPTRALSPTREPVLCEMCRKEPPKFRITLRNGTKQKVCGNCVAVKQESQKTRKGRSESDSPALAAPQSVSPPPHSNSASSTSSPPVSPASTVVLDQSMLAEEVPPPPPAAVVLTGEDGPPPPPPSEPPPHADFLRTSPPPPPSSPPPPPDDMMFDEPPPPPAETADEAPATNDDDRELQQSYRQQSERRKHRLDVARSRIGITPEEVARAGGASSVAALFGAPPSTPAPALPKSTAALLRK